MSAQDNITFRHESTSPLMGHSTAWSITYQGRPFYAVLHHHRGDFILRIDTLDTQRAIQTTSKRGQAITEIVMAAHAEMFPTDKPEESQEPEALFHVEHSRSDKGVSTLCGELIQWRTRTGEERAVTGSKATRGRRLCPSCVSIKHLREELQDADLSPLSETSLLDEVDRPLSSNK